MQILVLEASTASAKAMLYKSDAGVLATLPLNYSAAAGDTITLDADKVVAETLLAGRRLLAENGVDKVDMVATGSIWGHSLVMLDQKKRPVSPLFTWADTRAAATTARYRQDDDFYTALYHRTGCPIHTTYTLWKYIHEKESGNAAAAAFIAALPDYLFLRLTNRFAVSRSTASGGGFLNLYTLAWDEEALKVAGINDQQLPALVDPEYTAPLAGEAAAALGLPAGTPVLITGADGCMNQVAAGACGDNIMTMSVGTSAALRLTTAAPLLAARPSTWCYVGVENTWIVGSATAGAGNCVDWIGKKILGAHSELTLEDLGRGAETAAKPDAPIFLPFLAGERCPGWDDKKTAMFCGLRLHSDIYQLYYAVLEGVLFNLKQCYDLTVPIVGRTPKFISASGGIEKSSYWLTMAASIFGLPVYVDGLLHASLLGVAYMGLKAAGELKSVKDVKPLCKRRIDPDAGQRDLYLQRFARYMDHYRRQAASCSLD